MICRVLLASAFVGLLAFAHVSAATCTQTFPAGAYVTPACTYIVEQYDPGMWKDNLGHYWVLLRQVVNGVSVDVPTEVKLGGGIDPK